MLVSPTINNLHGRIRSITGTDPAAQTEILEVVPDRRRWRLFGLNFELITDATVITRSVILTIDDGISDLLAYQFTTTQIASLTRSYNLWSYSAPEVLTGDRIYAPFPPLILPAGFRLRTATASFQAGDNYSAPQLLVEEWIDP